MDEETWVIVEEVEVVDQRGRVCEAAGEELRALQGNELSLVR